ncbi:MAG: glycoside hydrolase family 3 C-terminal domain-containing protein [Lachnospiraceae bacterium]|nr:glycoside hydrolase family 3 C-terminal domain-containing protein [Lachnospiraceae bacterium]MCD7956730.1 glycoside hydrolase family 3 C-terminal domain-containing protein [Lachnospiraceae bacterium]
MAKKASDHFKTFANPGGPVITTMTRPVIEADGLYFKDIDGSGTVSEVNDWRLPAAQRAAAYVKQLTVDEKIGQLFISDWRMGQKYPNPMYKDHVVIPDESGVLDEGEVFSKLIFGEMTMPGTTTLIKDWFARHTILRENATPEDLTDYLNQLQAVAEECERFVPVQAASNSRNENGEAVFGMNDAGGVFPTWPGTLGIAAAVKGAGIEVADQWAEAIRRSWEACNLRKGYMYMVDCMTDPRWQRSYGTFGEDTALICEIAEHILPRIQGSEDGVTADGVAMTTKHFPGGGARENGFDPHYAAGQWNVYATPGSLKKYHLPGFAAAVGKKTSSIMPYYSKPAAEKSAAQQDPEGRDIRLDPYGFAYNRVFINDILRGQMGFGGYVNSDTGIVHNMSWGVEMLDEPERIGFAVSHSGVDLISGLFDNAYGRKAYDRAKNGYYETHELPEGFTPDMVTLTDESLDRAVERTLTEMFALGMFENTYRDAKKATFLCADPKDLANADRAHHQSVVLLKNDGILPLTAEKYAGKKVYAKAFHKTAEAGETATSALRKMLSEMTDVTLTEDYTEADIAILFVDPSSGAYFSATAGYLELDICEGKEVPDVDDLCRPTAQTHLETTLTGAKKIAEIADAVHARGGKIVANINFHLAWLVGNVECHADALTAGFETNPDATLDVLFGHFTPVGRLPFTLPRGDEVLSVNKEGICISPNDVPGYDKDPYMPENLKDENGKAYAYRDAAGNYYELNFGLTW